MATSRIETLRNNLLDSTTSLYLERTQLYTESLKQTEGEPRIIRQAKALAHMLEGIPVRILPGELIVGVIADKIRGAIIYPEAHGARVIPELEEIKNRDKRSVVITDEDMKIVQDEIESYWADKSTLAHGERAIPEKTMEVVYSGSVFLPTEAAGFGHLSINYPMLFSMGFNKFKATAEERVLEYAKKTDPDSTSKAQFYSAAVVVAEAVIHFAQRYAEEAARMARDEKDSQRREELEQIAEISQRVPGNPPTNFYEAIQFIRFTHLALTIEAYDGQAISMGRMDQYLQPFYEADVKSGILDRDRARELIELLWIKTNELVPVYDSFAGLYFDGLLTTQAATIGGINPEGVDSTNDMTYIILEATKNTGLPLPNVHIRLHKETPLKLLREVAATVASETNNIAMFNDDVIVKSWERQGIPTEEARNYATVGCVELAPFGTSFTSSDAALFNIAICLELALNNGETVLLGSKLGLETGDPLEFQSMDDVIEAFRKQLSYLVGLMAEASNHFETATAKLMPSPLLSLCVEDCFKAGQDITTGSARYNFTGVQGVGMADVADSLTAMDQLVFREKRLSMAELLEAIRDGFDDYEPTRQLLLNKAPKFGNDDKMADDYAELVARMYAEEVEKHKNIRGGTFIAGMYSVTSHIPFGFFTGALPSGRLATTTLSNGTSPAIGAPAKGLTAALSSVASVNHTLYANGVAYTLGLDPSFVTGGEGLESLVNVLRTYVKLGGMQIQFNMMDPETLRDAQKSPADYRNLIVRVAGYSAYFVDLSQEVQDEIIGRFQRSE